MKTASGFLYIPCFLLFNFSVRAQLAESGNRIKKYNKQEHIIVYPNPGNINFKTKTKDEQLSSSNTQIEISSEQGKLIYSSTIDLKNINEFDLSQSPKGIYYIKINNGEKIYTNKMIVQ